MWFINTRPSDRAQPLTQMLGQKGIDVLNLPLLVLKPVPWSSQLNQQFFELPHVQVIVVVSPTAATLGLQALKRLEISLLDLKAVTWIAVGKATAQVLEQAGIVPIIPDIENSEGMLEIPVLKSLNLHKVAVWRGKDGRQFLLDYLAQKQVEIFNCILYTREKPLQANHIFKEYQSVLADTHDPIYVCISSEASWKNWLEVCQNASTILMKCHYLILGQRLTNLVKKTHLHLQVTQIQSLKFDEIYTQMLDVKKER